MYTFCIEGVQWNHIIRACYMFYGAGLLHPDLLGRIEKERPNNR